MSLTERTAIARLVHRVGFGPKPGQFQSMLAKGFDAAASELLYAPRPAYGDVKSSLGIADLGPQPPPNSEGVVAYADAKRNQLRAMSLWWLDQMVVQDLPFLERMTWFWHGHWATSFVKVDEPVVMFDHIDKLRQHAVGNFSRMCEQMVLDGALIYWLDGQLNTASAPNENLARELMELFILGVDRYSEQDVKEAAKVLSGWKVVKSSGLVYQNPRQSFGGNSTVLGVSDRFGAVKLARFLAEQPSAQRFIPERLWYRFASSETALPAAGVIESMFAGREILPTMASLVYSMAYADAGHAVVKSPLEWMVGVLRALQITPSTYSNPDYLLGRLTNLGQRRCIRRTSAAGPPTKRGCRWHRRRRESTLRRLSPVAPTSGMSPHWRRGRVSMYSPTGSASPGGVLERGRCSRRQPQICAARSRSRCAVPSTW